MKLILGTAQFSKKYGVSNKTGKPKKKEIFKILKLAKKINIKSIDTAQNYLKCEEILGKTNLSKEFSFNTKLKNFSNIEKSVLMSLKKLKKKNINILYIHDSKILKNKKLGNSIFKDLNHVKSKKIIKNIGISIYTMSEFLFLSKNYEFDAIQIPLNIFNQNFDNQVIQKIVKQKKLIVEVRSIFMQGLIFMNKNFFKDKFRIFKKKIFILNKITKNNNLKKISICLNYLKSKKFIKNIIIGVNNENELKDIVKAYYSKSISKDKFKLFKTNSKLTDIRNW